VTLKEHKKHADLARPSLGNFCRNEWAFVGGQCPDIKALAGQIIEAFSAKYKCVYADSTHSDETLPDSLSQGAYASFTDVISYRHVNYNTTFNGFKQRQVFSEVDLMLVNGNHQQAKTQIVIICEGKKASLQKRVAQMTNVQMILLDKGSPEIFDFIKEALPNWKSIPTYSIDDFPNVIDFFRNKLDEAKPVLNGLVLAGGKSGRMGFDKGSVNFHGKAQRYYAADLLKSLCSEVFISCRSEQQKEINPAYATITDTFTGLGPFGAILSALREKPDCAWLVIACDLPLLTEHTLKYLVDHRNTSTIATAFQNDIDGFPEPLIAIWEPKSYPALLSFLAQGYSCPRKALINSDVTLLTAPNPEDLTNVNTPEQLDEVKSRLHSNIPAQ
jgi:molybdenum cofactor guanylyltransferase